MAVELTNSITKLNSASRPFQALKLNSVTSEIYCYILLKPYGFVHFVQHLYLATIISTQSSNMKLN